MATTTRGVVHYRFLHETDESFKPLEFEGDSIVAGDMKILVAKATGLEKEFARTFDLKLFLTSSPLPHTGAGTSEGLKEVEADSVFIPLNSRVVVQRVLWRHRPTIEHVASVNQSAHPGASANDVTPSTIPDKHRTLRPFPPEYICPLCSLVLTHPVVVRCASKCGLSACRNCVQQKLSEKRACPFCQGRVQSVIANKALAAIVSRLNFDDFQRPSLPEQTSTHPHSANQPSQEVLPFPPDITFPAPVVPSSHVPSEPTAYSAPLPTTLCAAPFTLGDQPLQYTSTVKVEGSAPGSVTLQPDIKPLVTAIPTATTSTADATIMSPTVTKTLHPDAQQKPMPAENVPQPATDRNLPPPYPLLSAPVVSTEANHSHHLELKEESKSGKHEPLALATNQGGRNNDAELQRLLSAASPFLKNLSTTLAKLASQPSTGENPTSVCSSAPSDVSPEEPVANPVRGNPASSANEPPAPGNDQPFVPSSTPSQRVTDRPTVRTRPMGSEAARTIPVEKRPATRPASTPAYEFDATTNSWRPTHVVSRCPLPSDSSFSDTGNPVREPPARFTTVSQLAFKFPHLSYDDFLIIRQLQRELALALHALGTRRLLDSSRPSSNTFSVSALPSETSQSFLPAASYNRFPNDTTTTLKASAPYDRSSATARPFFSYSVPIQDAQLAPEFSAATTTHSSSPAVAQPVHQFAPPFSHSDAAFPFRSRNYLTATNVVPRAFCPRVSFYSYETATEPPTGYYS